MNIGMVDRVIRMFAGIGIVVFDYLASPMWELVFLAVGLWSVLTSVFGWCPFYRVLGYNTCPTNFTTVSYTHLTLPTILLV